MRAEELREGFRGIVFDDPTRPRAVPPPVVSMMRMLNPHRISSGERVSFSHLGTPLVLRRRDRVRQQEAETPAGCCHVQKAGT